MAELQRWRHLIRKREGHQHKKQRRGGCGRQIRADPDFDEISLWSPKMERFVVRIHPQYLYLALTDPLKSSHTRRVPMVPVGVPLPDLFVNLGHQPFHPLTVLIQNDVKQTLPAIQVTHIIS
jgi:hypothetical protein